MWRWIVVLLLAANALYFAFGRGWLAPLGLAPVVQRDPARLTQQVRPQLLRVLPPSAVGPPVPAAPPASAAAPATSGNGASDATPAVALACLETDPLSDDALGAAESLLATALPTRGWVRVAQESPPQYAVVIGPLAGRDALQKKVDELARLRVAAEPIKLAVDGANSNHVALGRYEQDSAAQAALQSVALRGVRTARVALLRAAQPGARLRLDNLAPDPAQALRGLVSPSLGASQRLRPCAALPAPPNLAAR
jgi:hypothetical protein